MASLIYRTLKNACPATLNNTYSLANAGNSSAGGLVVATRHRSRYARTKVRIAPDPPKFGDPGDIVRELPKMDKTTLRPKLAQAKEMVNELNPLVGRVLSLEYADNKQVRSAAFHMMRESTQRDAYDQDSPEVEITRMTIQVRNLIRHIFQFPQDKVNKNRMIRIAGSRRKRLEQMYVEDHTRFHWLCKVLQLAPEPPRTPEYYIFYGKKQRAVIAHERECEKVKARKLRELKGRVEAEREEWQGRRRAVLEELREEEELVRRGRDEVAGEKQNLGLVDDAQYRRHAPDKASPTEYDSVV